jgi:hypothetical protein
MPAGFPIHDGTPYRELHVRRWGLGFVHHSRAILCRPVPNLSRYDPQLLHRCTLVRLAASHALASPACASLTRRCSSCEAGSSNRPPAASAAASLHSPNAAAALAARKCVCAAAAGQGAVRCVSRCPSEPT